MAEDQRRERKIGTDVERERGLKGEGEESYAGREHDLPIRSKEEMEERGADKAVQVDEMKEKPLTGRKPDEAEKDDY